MDSKKTLIICFCILIVGAGITALIFMTEPTATRVAATKKTAMLVDVVEVERGTYRPVIVVTGTIEAEQDIILSPQVGGRVLSLSSTFTPGGFIKKGQVLLQIDPADYHNALLQKKSDLSRTTADLNIEMGRQNVAQKDYQILDETLSGELEALVLRQPQLNAARARVEAAQAAVNQAELELQRTTIKAPFDAHILSRNANVGSLISPRDNLGRLVGLDTYWVVTTVPLSKIPWLSFPNSEAEKGSLVQIRNRVAEKKGAYRTGSLHRLIGALAEKTRMARVLISVSDPLAHQDGSAHLSPLMIGAFVETHIEANEIPNVVRLARDYIRADNTVWVMQDGLLQIRSVEIVFQDTDYAYISDGLQDKDRVVTTNLSRVADGAELRVKSVGKEDPKTLGDTQ